MFQICISSICQTECISPLKHAMQSRRDMIAIACETLNRLFSTNEDRLIKQVNKTLTVIVIVINLKIFVVNCSI